MRIILMRQRRWRKLKIAAASIALVLGALLVWGFVIEPDRLVVRPVTLNLPRWPAGMGELKLIALSDLHAGAPHIDAEKLDDLIATVNARNPDVIVLLGDFVISGVPGGEYTEPAIAVGKLAGLRARHGVFAVLGNHDWMEDGPGVMLTLQNAGIRVLENEVTAISHNGRNLWLVGLADLWFRRPDVTGSLAKVTDDGPVIVLTHNPDVFPTIPARVALTLAGHTHGGQVNLPFLGRLVVPSQYGARYAIGHIIEDDRHLYVTPGIGTSILPVRFLVPPEISVLTLKGRN